MEASSSSSLKSQAVAFLQQGNPTECIRCLQSALVDNPQDGQAYSYLGAAQSMAKNWEEAIPAFRRALELTPSGRAHYNLGLALESAGVLEEASSQFAGALAMDATYQPAHDAFNRATQARMRTCGLR